MPSPRRHYLDDLAEDLFEWMQEETRAMVLAFTAGGRSPFAAQVTEKQKLEFYQRAFFNPDGSPNQQGRAATLARVGADGYAEIMKALLARRQGDIGTAAEERGEIPGVPDEAEEG